MFEEKDLAKFRTAITAMVTPFRDGKVDEKALWQEVDWQIEEGIGGLVPCGTTGESPTLSHDEHDQVIEIVIEEADGRVPVIAGTGSNSTAEAIRLSEHAAKAGADGILLVNPYYNKPTQEGLYKHFWLVAKSVPEIPVILYNIQGRTGVNIETPTMVRLVSDCPNIVGVKEASGNIAQMMDVINDVKKVNPHFVVLSGDDNMTLPLMCLGGDGVISVASNIVPRDVATLVKLAQEGSFIRAREFHYKLLPIFKAMFYETNPIMVKATMDLMGKILPEIRLPMTEPSAANLEKLKAVLRQYKLIS